MINTTDIEQARKLIRKEAKPIIIQAQDLEFNRKILESGGFDILLSPEKYGYSRSTKKSNSGLNNVLAAIASKNKISIGIDLDEIRNLSKKEKAQRLAKIRVNLRICRKEKTPIKIVNYQDEISAKSLFQTLGASTEQLNKAF
jgi:RNase P/RNase MRP subunit p30